MELDSGSQHSPRPSGIAKIRERQPGNSMNDGRASRGESRTEQIMRYAFPIERYRFFFVCSLEEMGVVDLGVLSNLAHSRNFWRGSKRCQQKGDSKAVRHLKK